MTVNDPTPDNPSVFSILLDTAREQVELMAECAVCGAMTMLPIEIAWVAISSPCWGA